MRIGFIGPADADTKLLRTAAECILGDERVDQVVYLGNDEAVTHMALDMGPGNQRGPQPYVSIHVRWKNL